MKIEMGKKYKTRNGRDVRIITTTGPGDQPVIGIVHGKNSPDSWGIDGIYLRGKLSCNTDLVEVPESTTIYAAAADIAGGYAVGASKQDVETHAWRNGPVVEVTLPRDPPKPPKVKLEKACAYGRDGMHFVQVQFSNGAIRDVQLPGFEIGSFEIDHTVVLAAAPPSEDKLIWHSNAIKPGAGAKVLASILVPRYGEDDLRSLCVMKWDGKYWQTQSSVRIGNGVRVLRWAHFNED